MPHDQAASARSTSQKRHAPRSGEAPDATQQGAGAPSGKTSRRHDSNGNASKTAQRLVTTNGFFDVMHAVSEHHTVQLIMTREDEKRLRLTILCSERAEGEGTSSKNGSSKDEEKKPPIANQVLVGTPEEFDDPESGVASFWRTQMRQAGSLAEAKARADRAHELALKAEKKRESEAKQRKQKADPGGPLFSDASEEDDAGDDDASEDESSGGGAAPASSDS